MLDAWSYLYNNVWRFFIRFLPVSFFSHSEVPIPELTAENVQLPLERMMIEPIKKGKIKHDNKSDP